MMATEKYKLWKPERTCLQQYPIVFITAGHHRPVTTKHYLPATELQQDCVGVRCPCVRAPYVVHGGW